MTDEDNLESDGDDALARIRARFEQASERIMSGSDDLDLPLPATPAAPSGSSGSTALIGTEAAGDDLDDFGEIDIQSDAGFSLDFEHGVSGTQIPRARSQVAVNLRANMNTVREHAPERVRPSVDDDRHAKHRTRGHIGASDEAGPDDGGELPTAPVVVAAEPQDESKFKQARKEKRPTSRDGGTPPATPAAREEDEPARLSRAGLMLIFIVLLAAGGAGAFLLFGVSTDPAPTVTATVALTTTAAPATPTVAAVAALDAFGFKDLKVGVDETGVATITGTVRSSRERDIAISAVAGVDGIVDVVADLRYVSERAATAIQADADVVAAADEHEISVTVTDGIATITGVVPRADIEAGMFGEAADLQGDLLAIDGVEEVRLNLTPKGNPVILQKRLSSTLIESPIFFEEDSAELTAAAAAVLDTIATRVLEEPGLGIRIAVRGDDDANTEELAAARLAAAVAYLQEAGLDAVPVDAVLVADLAEAIQAFESDVLVEVVDPDVVSTGDGGSG